MTLEDPQTLAKILEIYKATSSKIDFARELYRLSEDADFTKEATDYLFGIRTIEKTMEVQDGN